MADLEFLAEYNGQSLDELLAMETTHRIDSLVLAMESALIEKTELKGPGSLSPEEQVIVAVEALEREVNNGGYHQFFGNSSGEYAGNIEAALRAIGCQQHADIAGRAVQALGIDGPLDGDAIDAALSDGGEELHDALDPLDQEFYMCEESIENNLFAFVISRKSDIHLR